MVIEEDEERDRNPDERGPDRGKERCDTRQRGPDQRAVDAEDPIPDERDDALIESGDSGAEQHGASDVADVPDQLPDLPVGKRHDFDQPGGAGAALDEQVVAGQGGEDEDEDEAERGGDHRRRALAEHRGQVAEQLTQAALDARRLETQSVEEGGDVVAEEPCRSAVLIPLRRAAQQIEHARADHEEEEGEQPHHDRHHQRGDQRSGETGMPGEPATLEEPFLQRIDGDRDGQSEKNRDPDRLERLPEQICAENEQRQESTVLELRAVDSWHEASLAGTATACAQEEAR